MKMLFYMIGAAAFIGGIFSRTVLAKFDAIFAKETKSITVSVAADVKKVETKL